MLIPTPNEEIMPDRLRSQIHVERLGEHCYATVVHKKLFLKSVLGVDRVDHVDQSKPMLYFVIMFNER